MREHIAMPGVPTSQLHMYLRVLRRYARSIFAMTAAVMVVAGVVSFRLPSTYFSEAKILVKPVSLESNQPGNVTAPNMETEQQVAKSLVVAQLAAKSLNLSLTPDQIQQLLLKNLRVTSTANTEILDITYTAKSPSLARSRAGAFSDAYLQFRRDQVVNDLTSAQGSLQERIDALGSQLTQVNTLLAHTRDPDRVATLRAQANSLIQGIGFLQGNIGSLLTPEQLAVGAVTEQLDPSQWLQPRLLVPDPQH